MMGAMDHQEVRDILADAAVEPDGLERLMAGDTPTAALVAGHLAGCSECADELGRLHRSVGLIRPTVRSVPPPELRERTLAYVRAVGRPRGAETLAAESAFAGSPPAVDAPSAPGPPADRTAPRAIAGGRWLGGSRRLPLVAGLAAALALSVAGTAVVVNATRDSQARSQTAEIDALGDVAMWTLRVDAQPDVKRVQLASVTGGATTGTLVFSPSSTELVMIADQLAPAPAGHEYRCWVEIAGKRSPIGKMFFGGQLAYWVGNAKSVASAGSGARFGVSLVDLAAVDQPGQPVLLSAG